MATQEAHLIDGRSVDCLIGHGLGTAVATLCLHPLPPSPRFARPSHGQGEVRHDREDEVGDTFDVLNVFGNHWFGSVNAKCKQARCEEGCGAHQEHFMPAPALKYPCQQDRRYGRS